MRVRIAKWEGRRREMMMTVMMTSWFSSSPTKHRDWRGSCLRVHDARRMYYFPCIHFCEKSVTWWWCWMKMMMTMIQIEKTDLNWRVDKFADVVVWFDRRCNRRRDSNAIRMWFRCDSDVIQMWFRCLKQCLDVLVKSYDDKDDDAKKPMDFDD